jgi:hypothetical protein
MEYNNTNTTINCTANSSFILGDTKTITLYANDTAGNVGSASKSWDYSVFQNSLTYTTPVYSSILANFNNNVSYSGTNILANLWYNGTKYTSTKSLSGSDVIFTNYISILSVTTTQNRSFFYEYSLTNSSGTYSINSTLNYQIVNPAIAINTTSGSCPSGLVPAFTFDFQSEQNFTKLIATKVNYNFAYGVSNTTAIQAYGTLSSVNNFSICINNSMAIYSVGSGEIEYQIDGYSNRKYFIFSGTRVTNSTINITLYALETASSTAFQLTAQTSTGVLYKNDYYIGLMRWYPQLNQYNMVEVEKTDDKGQSVFEIRTTDTDYRFAVYYLNGTVVKILNPLKMVCASSPCAYTIFADGTSLDYTSQFQLEDSLTYNSTTKIVTYIWSDATQKTNAMNMTVTRLTGSGETTICSTSATGYTGVLECDLTGQTGTLTVRIFRSASPFSYIKEKIIDLGVGLLRDVGSGNGKFFALIAIVILGALGVLVGIYNPYAGIIIGCAALIPLFIWGGISVGYLIGFIILGGVVIYFIRKT